MSSVKDKGRYASIDIGSHTIRMMVADLDGEKIRPILTERRITRLARGFRNGGTLKSEEMERSLTVLEEYAAILKEHGVESIACGATGVVRRAGNGEGFLEAVAESTRIPAAIISESEEAFLSAKGVMSVLPPGQDLTLSFDLGGSSTEFLLMQRSTPEPLWSTSVFIGAATLTEAHLKGDPPEPSSVALAREAARAKLAPAIATAASYIESHQGTLQLVGTAGTVTTLAAMFLRLEEYKPFLVNGLILHEEWLDRTIDHLAQADLDSRRRIPGLERGREDIILGGALITREILRGTGQPQLTVTDAGLLEGLLLDLIERKQGLPRALASPLTWRLERE